MYKVVRRFADAQDKNYVYEIGDIYPREGVKPTKARIEELASNKNAAGKVLIEKLMAEPEEEAEPQKVEIISEEAKPEAEKEAKPKAKK